MFFRFNVMIMQIHIKKKVYRKFHKVSVIVILAMLSVITLSILYGPYLLWGYYLNYRGGDLISITGHRRIALDRIWSQLVQFKEVNGQWPENRSELEHFVGSLDDLLRVPASNDDEQYKVNFAALGSHTVEIVIADPGIFWPPMKRPNNAILPSGYPDYEYFRPILLNNGDSRSINIVKDQIGKPRD